MPRHIRNILIAALLAILALSAGITGYVHHQFKTYIDSNLRAIQPFAQVKYSDLSTSLLSGKVELKNIRVSSSLLPETLTLGDLTFETPGFAYMLQGPESMSKGELPEHFGFAINDFYFDLTGATGEWLERLVKRMQPLYASNRKICGGKTLFAPSDYQAMGYTRLQSNMRFAYDFNQSKRTLNVVLNASTTNMADIKANIIFSNISSMSSDKISQGRIPQLTSVDITYKDKTYGSRIVKYCAELDKTTKEEFIEAEIKQPDEYFYKLWGFAPGFGLREAYKDYLLKPDLVTMTMSPGKDFNPLMFVTMSQEQLIEALNISLKVNGLVVTDLSFKVPTQEFVTRFEEQRARSLDFDALLRGEEIKAPEPVVKPKVYVKQPGKYHPIKLSNISKHVTDFVQITTKTGNIRKGQLLRIDKNNLYVQKKVSGGKFIMTVPRSKIKSIKAYFSIKVLK